MFDLANLALLGPWLVLSLGIMATMLVSSIRIETRLPAKIVTIITLVLVMITSIGLFSEGTKTVLNGYIEISKLSCMTLFFMSGISLMFVVGSGGYLNKEKIHISDTIIYFY